MKREREREESTTPSHKGHSFFFFLLFTTQGGWLSALQHDAKVIAGKKERHYPQRGKDGSDMGCVGRLVGDGVNGAGGDVGRVEAVISRHRLDLTWFSEGDVDALQLLAKTK